MGQLYYGDNLDILRRKIQPETVDLCYIDPPFNSKRNYNQIYNNIGSEDRAQAQAFTDTWIWDDYAAAGFFEIFSPSGGFTTQTVELIKGLHKVLKEGSLLAYLVHMTLRIAAIHRVLKPTGSLYLHCDPTSSHYLKLIIDGIFVAGGANTKTKLRGAMPAAEFLRNILLKNMILFSSIPRARNTISTHNTDHIPKAQSSAA